MRSLAGSASEAFAKIGGSSFDQECNFTNADPGGSVAEDCNEQRADRTTSDTGPHMIDFLLGAVLLFGWPSYMLLRSRSKGGARADKRANYVRSAGIVATFLTILLVDWLANSRGAAELGLAFPNAGRALGGLLLAVLVAIGLLLSVVMKSGTRPTEKLDEQTEAAIPRSQDELRWFVMFAIVGGFGWEVLYRGFLLFWLSPIIGLKPAVAVSAIAYGLAHGFKSWIQAAGSLVSAFLFTIGYAATGSLWWLIVLHISLPLTITVFAQRRVECTVVLGEDNVEIERSKAVNRL